MTPDWLAHSKLQLRGCIDPNLGLCLVHHEAKMAPPREWSEAGDQSSSRTKTFEVEVPLQYLLLSVSQTNTVLHRRDGDQDNTEESMVPLKLGLALVVSPQIKTNP